MDDPVGDDPALWPEVAAVRRGDDPAAIAATLEVLGERLYVGPYLSSVMARALLPDVSDRVAVAAADESGHADGSWGHGRGGRPGVRRARLRPGRHDRRSGAGLRVT